MAFIVSKNEIEAVLHDFGIDENCAEINELQRYDYDAEHVRLIVNVKTSGGKNLVIRFKNEKNVTQELMEQQSRFAALLAKNGIETPKLYTSSGRYVLNYRIAEQSVNVCVEDFTDGELKIVDAKTAEKTGELLARMHDIAEKTDAHVENEVLFDPLKANDLFSFENYISVKDRLIELDEELYHKTVNEYERLMAELKSFSFSDRYAVQGDLSNCNLYRTASGDIGIFDFNNCGDANLFLDAAMEAVFEATLMDYPDELADNHEQVIMPAFLKGYNSIRPFTREQKRAFEIVYALCSAFSNINLRWYETGLINAVKSNDDAKAREWMERIFALLTEKKEMPLY